METKSSTIDSLCKGARVEFVAMHVNFADEICVNRRLAHGVGMIFHQKLNDLLLANASVESAAIGTQLKERDKKKVKI